MNSLVQFYRQQFPSDTKSDEEIMGDYAEAYPQDQLAQYPDFLADWQKIQQQKAVEQSSMLGELGSGFSRGVLGLESTGAGALAILSSAVGAEGAKEFYQDIYKRKVKQMQEEAPASVPTIQQAAQSFPAAGQYVAGKVGELIPNVGEALAFAGAGTALAPGPGTEAGAVAGLFGRAAARSALRKAVEKGLTAAGRQELEDYAAGKIAGDALSEGVAKLVKDASGHMASVATSAANFAALGAGGAYGELSGREGVTEERARTGALIAGAGASLGALIPERLLKAMFGEGISAEPVRRWIDAKAVTVPKELLVAGSGMGAMEFFNILGEKYADPKKREEDFTKDDWSRMLNAAATGIIAGAPAAGIAAIRGGRWTPERVAEEAPVPSAPETPTPPEAPPAGPEAGVPTPPPPTPTILPPSESVQAKVMESRRLMLEAQQQARKEIKKEAKVVGVPETPEEERMTVVEEIRKNEARTIRDIQELFPKAELNREQARELRNAAWGSPDARVAEAYGEVTPEQRIVLLDIANKEVAGTMTDADRGYIQKLSAGQKEQYKIIREGVEDATQKREEPKRVLSERERADAQLQKEAQDREQQAKLKEEGAKAGAGDSLQQAARELDPKVKEILKIGGVDVDALGVTPPPGEAGATTPVDVFAAKAKKARERALSDEAAKKPAAPVVPAPEKAPPPPAPLAPPPTQAPVEVPKPAASGWIGNVRNTHEAWREVLTNNPEAEFYKNIGSNSDSKNESKALGVFEAPDGSIVVASIYSNRGHKVFIPLKEPGVGSDWNKVIEAGYKPIGHIRLFEAKSHNYARDVYQVFSKADWEPIQADLFQRKIKGRGEVVPVQTMTPAERAATGTREEGGETGIPPARGIITSDLAGRLVEKVIKLGSGIPTDSERAFEYLEQVLNVDKGIAGELSKIGGGRKNPLMANLMVEVFRRYEKAYEDFRNSGSVDPAEFRSRIIGALEGLSAKEAAARTADIEARQEDVRYEGGLTEGKPEEVLPDPNQRGHLAVGDIGRDNDTSPGFQAAVRNILANARNAFDALVALNRQGAFGDSKIVNDLIALGDHGTRLEIGGAHTGEDGRMSSGRYDPVTHTAIVYDTAFSDGASLRTFLHEYVHGNTVFNMETGRNRGELAFLYEFAREQAEKQGKTEFYGLTNHAEFIAEAFSDPKFQNFLRSLKSTGINKSLWTRFLEWVGSMIGIRDATLLDDVISVGKNLSGTYKPIRIQVPESARTMQWHTPTTGSKTLAESYNPVTGVVERAPLVQDSVEAAMLNIQRSDPLEFLLPAGTTGPIPTVDPSIRMNNEAGINNKVESVRRAAAEAVGLPLKAFRTLFGLHSTEKVRELQINDAQVRGIQGFNPHQDMASLVHPDNVDYTNLGASESLQKELGVVSRRRAAAKELDPKLKAAQQKLLTEHQEILDKFKDAEFMSGVIKRGAKKLLYEDIRDLERVGKAVGAAFQQYQDIEGKIGQPIDPATVAAMRRLYTGDALQGEKLFNFLDQMANDPSIDFTRPASEIRAYIRHAAEMDPTLQRYAQLAADTSDAKALLSTVIAFGKLNQRELAMLQARRMESGTAREALIQQLRDQRKETNEQILQGIKSVAKASRLEEAAKLENRKALRLISRVNRNVEHNDRIISAADAAIPFYTTEIEKLTAKIQRRADSVFTSGMKMRVPTTMDAHPKWEERTVNLNPTKGPVTTPDQLRAAVGQMAGWMRGREDAARAGDETALGWDYQTTKQQVHEIMNNQVYQPMLRETDFTALGLTMSADGKAVGAIGLPVTGLIEQGMNKFAGDTNNIRTQADNLFGYKNSRLLGNVIDVLNEGQKWWQRKRVTSSQFINGLTDSVLGFIERGRAKEGVDREVSLDEWYGKVGPWLLSQPEYASLISDRMPQFMKAMREYAESIYHSGQWAKNKTEEAGLGVKDPRLGGQIRKHMDVGLRTFQRKFSDSLRNMVHVMRAAGWSKDDSRGTPGASEEWKQIGAVGSQDPAKAQAMVDKYMTDTIQKDFAFKLTHVPDESVFDTPVLDDSGTTARAKPEDVAQAYDEAGGNLIQMFQKLHDIYNGQEAVWSYVQTGLLRMAAVYHEVDSALKKMEPKGNVQVADIEGMVPNFMIDARQFQHLPADWFTYHKFDRNDNARMAERLAWQKNFGRDGQRFASWYATAQEEVKVLTGKLDDALAQAERLAPNSRKTEIDAAMARVLAADKDPLLSQFKTGADRLRYLRKVKSRAHFLDNLLPNLHTFFNRGNQEEGSLRWGIRVAGELASLLVNRPGAAIGQFATTFDILAKWGLSPTTARATATAMKMTGKDIAGSLAQGVGWEFLKASYYEQRLNEMKLNDPEVARRMGDINIALTGEEHSPVAKWFRKAKELQSATLNLRGEKAQYTPLRIFAPFFQMVTSTNRGLFVALSNMADGFITKGIKYLESNPGTDKLTADMLGLKGEDARSFELWEADHRRYGLDFTEMAKGALERKRNGDNTVLTNKELERIFSVGLNVISLESNVATMPLWAFNNSLVRFALPLLGWSFRRAVQVPGLRLDAKDQNSLKAVRSGLMGMAAVGLSGLGLSLVVDAYTEDVLGKKRNLRGLRVPTTGSDWVGLQERLNRVGTFGLWGEMLNAGVNVGTGQGDNRMLSVDQRVITMQAFQALLKASSNFINQDFDPDYRNVVRPAISAIGGGGMLEYMQIIGHAFDLDNVESRVVKRINAENYLRVTGRDLGMSIRTGGGGYNTPTPITPWIARMEYAAYANDPAEFREMYQGAIEEAKKAGKPNPADYVKRAFETRHPLRYVFAQVPSEREYRQVLANLNDQGQESVQDAVRLFNYYGQHIGLTPFLGSAKKDQQRVANPAAAARAMALAY